MMLTVDQASKLVAGATQSRVRKILRALRAHGLTPVKMRGKGSGCMGQGGQWRVSLSQVTGMLLFHILKGIDDDCRHALMRHVASTPDEQLEAKLATGQHYLVKTGSRCVPELWPLEAARLIERERADMLRQLGLPLEIIDCRPFCEQLFAAARSLTTADEGASSC